MNHRKSQQRVYWGRSLTTPTVGVPLEELIIVQVPIVKKIPGP
jgi:hypothetical protein